MTQRLPIFRAARLAGVTRSALQRKIHAGELNTFEGMVSVDELLRVFPRTTIDYDSEYERVQAIKAQAFARRVQEYLIPDANVLAQRLAELGQDLAVSRSQLNAYRRLLAELRQKLTEAATSNDDNTLATILNWLETAIIEAESADESAQHYLAQDTVLRIMAAHITIRPSNDEYWLEGNDTLLDAGVKSGLALNYGCTGGNCGLCKARLIRGEVRKTQHHDYVLSEAEKNSHYILMCSNTAVSDVELEALVARDEHDIPLQEVVTRVKSIDGSHPGIIQLHLQTPRSQRLRFLAGQSVKLILDDGRSDTFPIASCPCDDRNILFHLDREAGSPLLEPLLHNTEKGAEITIVGPHGDFLFDDDSTRIPIFVAYGVGFAPIKSLIEHATALEAVPAMHLYWKAEQENGLYAHNLCRSWADALEEFHYYPLINEDPVARITATHAQPGRYDIYLAGPEAQVKQAGMRLLEAGFPPSQLAALSL